MTDETTPTEPGNGSDKAWVIIRTADAFKVYTPSNPNDFHIVRANGIPTCTCAEYKAPGRENRVPCSHISAVLAVQGGKLAPRVHHAISPATRVPEADNPKRRGTAPSEDATRQMLIKRSVSPDGRIDSLSVEFSLPVAKLSTSDIKASASRALALQSEIVEGFRGRKGSDNGRNPETEQADGTVYACITGVEAMDTKWGRRLYLAFTLNSEQVRLFGSPKRLGEILTFAGFPEYSQRITERLVLDLPCRVTVEPTPDGRYMKIRRVFPAKS